MSNGNDNDGLDSIDPAAQQSSALLQSIVVAAGELQNVRVTLDFNPAGAATMPQTAGDIVVRHPIDDNTALFIHIPADPTEQANLERVQSGVQERTPWAELLNDQIGEAQVNDGVVVLQVDENGQGTISWLPLDAAANRVDAAVQPRADDGGPGVDWDNYVQCRDNVLAQDPDTPWIEAFRTCFSALTQ